MPTKQVLGIAGSGFSVEANLARDARAFGGARSYHYDWQRSLRQRQT